VSAATPVTRPTGQKSGERSVAAPARVPEQRPATRAPLSVVRTRPRQSRAPFVVLVVGLLVSGLVALLLLNTALTQGAFQEKHLAGDLKQLTGTQQALRLHLAAMQEPRSLAERATQLGLVPSQCPVFLRLPAADVLGKPCAARAAVKRPPAVVPTRNLVPNSTGTPKGAAPAATSAGSKTAATKSGSTKPAATKPASTKPAATKPASTKPAATKPAATTATGTSQKSTVTKTTAPAKAGGR
jgi:hypothetical protein